MPLKTLLLLLIVVPAVLAAPVDAGTDTRLPEGPIRFNVSPGGYPPYTMVHDDGSVSGIFWDVMVILARQHDYQLEVQQIPTKRVDGFLLRDELDVTMRAREWTDQPDAFVFTDGILKARDSIFRRADSPLHSRTLDDLEGTILLTNLGYHHPRLESRFASGRIRRIDVPNTLNMLQRLHNGQHLQGGVANRRAAQWIIRQHGWQSRFRIEPVALDVTEYRLMFAPKWAPLMDGFNRTLTDLRRSGTLDEIIARYLPEGSAPGI
ncbi:MULTISPECIES: substrate-binding periplasmic protein [Marinobacter]|uniref:substrate-binding periplasmic protein n=1 Tax=Marinobacter TaxID=2742 RepID=UPI000DABA458|nr:MULTISPECIES: transporter substrate-binding domain-containing protein [Marinobacter]